MAERYHYYSKVCLKDKFGKFEDKNCFNFAPNQKKNEEEDLPVFPETKKKVSTVHKP